ncbi:hypothetical protein Q9295_10925 [Xinfangfangia sp. CPCC 101601]|uniref:Cation/multidrug efflux pump n=1 Tax=Pseudogemmobacter lacusdianii TaxID=3069608 RepID=A0ABU0VYR5_9RHOB|nr:hypothetical protein [Xinfangfangia sp. CPCC 101601]MDQ2066889.1 hypothetical protein [Xinfangfangia sp. CPCC 101601]
MMILGWLRLALVAMVVLTVVYVLIGIYWRSLQREALEKRWAHDAMQGDRDAWIEAGMKAYEGGLKKRLLWLIYILPMIGFSLIFFYVNWD